MTASACFLAGANSILYGESCHDRQQPISARHEAISAAGNSAEGTPARARHAGIPDAPGAEPRS